MSKIRVINIDKNTDYQKWLEYRGNGIGSSEVGTVMGENPWKSAFELYHEKVLQKPKAVTQNMAMFMGNRLEPLIADIWEHWHESDENMIANYDSAKKIRKCQEITGYLLNPDYPHLFFSPDRLIVDDYCELVNGDIVDTSKIKGVIEIKSISGYAEKQYVSKIPTSYIIQILTYMFGLGIEYGEIVSLKDGRELTVLPIVLSEWHWMVENIILETTAFWERVLKGREALAAGEDWEQFAPAPTGQQSDTDYIQNMYAVDPEKVISHAAAETLLPYAITDNELTAALDKAQEERDANRNMLKTMIGECEVVDFGKEVGRINWKPDSRGSRRFFNKVIAKEIPVKLLEI